MKTFLILFIIGITVSEIFFVISGIVKEDETSKDLEADLVTEWRNIDKDSKLVYYVIYAFFIPFSVFPILKKKLTKRWLNLYAFIGGVTFHYAVSQVITLTIL